MDKTSSLEAKNTMKLFGISRNAMIAAALGAGTMGGMTLVPTFLNAEAKPIVIEAPAGAPLSFADLIEGVSPAVVSVNVVSEQERSDLSELERFFDRFREGPFSPDDEGEEGDEDDAPTRQARSLGSGFFISGDGYIVTNNHVIDGATEIEVVLENGREYEARLVGTDAQTDLAVLKVDTETTFKYVEFGTSSDMRRGDWVVAVGNPFGLGGTATSGIVSAIGKPGDRGRSSTYTDYLQIDAAINRGNSGGPTFDLQGRVIGVNTAIYSPTGGSVGIGFAIPSDLAKQVTDSLIKDGKVSRGWLGVTIQDLTEDMAEARGITDAEGAIVSEVTNKSPAEASGIQRGDIIVEINGQDVTDATSTTRVVGSLLAGSDNQFVVLRDGRKQNIAVKVGERPDNLDAMFGNPNQEAPEDDSTESEEGPLGVSLRPLDGDTKDAFRLSDEDTGMVIADIDDDSPFAEAGLAPGMVLLDVNGRKMQSVDDLYTEINAAKARGRDKLLLAVRTGQRTAFVTVDIPSDD